MQKFESFYKQFLEKNLPPLNRRRKILLEKQYSFPSSGDKAVMDLYALYALWWQMGAGKEASGYEQDVIVPHKRRERVNRYFEEALATVSDVLLKESKEAIEDEIENVFDPYLVDSKKVFEWIKENGFLEQFQKAYNQGKGKNWFKVFSYGDTIDIFSAPFWEDADLYGGKNWVKITQAVRNLDNQIRRGNDKDLMFAVDSLLDHEHNTGSLSSKLDKMKVSKETLDLRSEFRKIQDFAPYVSPQVKSLIPNE